MRRGYNSFVLLIFIWFSCGCIPWNCEHVKMLCTFRLQQSAGVADEDFVSYVGKWCEDGACLIGGCCRTTPNTIRAITKALSTRSSSATTIQFWVLSSERERESELLLDYMHKSSFLSSGFALCASYRQKLYSMSLYNLFHSFFDLFVHQFCSC